MSGDPPPLPESSDPHELLGVSAAADEATLKRAYIELVKRYRPDRHPAEFRRVREAFERATAWLALHESAGLDDTRPVEGADDGRGAEGATTSDTGGDAPAGALRAADWEAAWSDVADGRVAEVLARLEAHTKLVPTDAGAWQLRFLLAELRGDADPAALLARGFNEGAELAGWALLVLEDDVLELAPELPWSVLVRQRDRDAAARLFDARLVTQVVRGTAVTFLGELRTPGFLDAARDHDGLRWIALRAACVTIFDAPDAADELFERLAREPIEEGSVEEAYIARRSLRDEWSRFAPAAELAPALRAFLAACHALHPVDLAALGLVGAIRAEPAKYLDAFDRLVVESPGLFHLFLEGAESCVAERSDAPLDGDAVAGPLEAFVAETDQRLDEDRGSRFDSFVCGLLVIGSIAGFIRFGWWGLLPLAATVAWLVVSVSRVDRRLYHEIVRPRALEAVLRNDVMPGDLVSVIEEHAKLSDDIGRFDGELTEDVGLHALALAIRTDPDVDSRDDAGGDDD